MTSNPMISKTATGNRPDPSDAGQASPEARQGLAPPVTLDGRPLLFLAVEGSAATPGACPVAIAWTKVPAMRAGGHLIQPTTDWLDKAWDHRHLASLGLPHDRIMASGTPAGAVALMAQASVRDHCLVMQQPALETPWLAELLLLQPDDICIKTISLTSLALLLADRIGLDEHAFAAVAADLWFRLLARRKAADGWAHDAAMLIQALLDEGVSRGIETSATIALRRRQSGCCSD
jgi:hypothetical protein